MRLPRVKWTMQRMMVAVALVAVDFGLIRWAEDQDRKYAILVLHEVSYIFAPTLSLLAIAAVNVARGLVKRGQAPAFSTGYLLMGALAALDSADEFAALIRKQSRGTLSDWLAEASPGASKPATRWRFKTGQWFE